MSMEITNDKLSIKNLLFSKAVPNYIIPVPINGHRVFGCTDCGDKFILESSYEHHINRKSVKISYMCRHCGRLKLFYNRCNLLSHIRSHTFKTATINVTDLKIDPLPITYFNMTAVNKEKSSNVQSCPVNKQNVCFECKKDINTTGTLYRDRVKHYMQYTNEVYSCPVCMFALPTICGLKSHLRIHLRFPPYYCPECGIHLANKNVFYPYHHDCEGFKMMRATVRMKCPIAECHLFHFNEIKEHLKNNHLKEVHKCPFCYVACFQESIMTRHLKTHKTEAKALLFYQCEMCPGRLVLQNQIENHLKTHINYANNTMYPCWACGTVFKSVPILIEHHVSKHGLPSYFNLNVLEGVPKKPNKRIYRVVKKCDQCDRSFTYKCCYDQIQMLPNECPFKCSTRTQTNPTNEGQIICHLCKNRISINWEVIKKHYHEHHKAHRCLDVRVVLEKQDKRNLKKNKIKKNFKRFSTLKNKTLKRNKNRNEQHSEIINPVNKIHKIPVLSASNNDTQFICVKCGYECSEKELLERHMVSHRDPCMAYQCMECGQSFVVKPSFSTHLLFEHGILDVEEYISKKQCYNEDAFMKYQHGSVTNNEPLRENQCSICREQFDSCSDLEKHFRVHGMAFLMKNNSNKNNSP